MTNAGYRLVVSAGITKTNVTDVAPYAKPSLWIDNSVRKVRLIADSCDVWMLEYSGAGFTTRHGSLHLGSWGMSCHAAALCSEVAGTGALLTHRPSNATGDASIGQLELFYNQAPDVMHVLTLYPSD